MRKHCTDCTFQWEDFSPVDYVNWQEGEPNDAGDGEVKGSTNQNRSFIIFCSPFLYIGPGSSS